MDIQDNEQKANDTNNINDMLYGAPAVKRPKIKATKQLNLSGDEGKQIVKSETKLVLRTHPKTFEKLADM